MVTVIVMAVLLYMKVRKKIGRIRITHPASFVCPAWAFSNG